MPYGFTLTGLTASVSDAPTGSALIADLYDDGTSVLAGSATLVIDAGEETSLSAAVPADIASPSLAADAKMTIDILQVGSTNPGKGLVVWLIGYQAAD